MQGQRFYTVRMFNKFFVETTMNINAIDLIICQE